MSYFDTTVFNRTAQQQKETNDLLRELIKTLQEQNSKCRYPTQNFEPPVPAQQPEVGVVAYLDVGANGYLDLGSELSEDALQQLPKGRHALVIAGTYGIDGYVATPQPPPTAQAADSVPAVEREQERIAFKDAHRHLELYEVPDTWGRPMFKHSHVEASWLGWITRASHGQAPAPTHEQIAAYLESTGAYVTNDATREAAIAEAIDTDRAKRGQAPDLHPKTSDLVQRFAAALAEKLSAAEKKYGYSDGWASPNWMDECRQHLSAHIAKGDPRDVAAYCAFLWHHDATTALPHTDQKQPN